MIPLANFHRAVQTTLASKRLGTPVFVRYQYHAILKGAAIVARLAKTTAVARDWLGQPLERVLAQGSAARRHISLLLEFRGGVTAVVTWIGTTGRGDGVDLTLIGNHGVIYHDAGDSTLWDEAFTSDDAPPERDLVTLIERAIKSGRPEPLAPAPRQGGQR
ncbi:MAG: hypothetical protein HYX68_08835 [Planctomycetes bacterium]|nr:hypothetical protein [Planctomycetota bacterium]